MNAVAWMDIALKKAAASLKVGEVPVGCLFIYNDKIIAESNNTVNETCNATRHAEMNCIDQVLTYSKEKSLDYKEVFSNIDIVVTVEPCIMCTSALYQLGVRSIIYGCKNDRFGGCISVFKVPNVYNTKVTVLGDIKSEEAISLLKNFYEGTNPNAPESKAKKISKTEDQ